MLNHFMKAVILITIFSFVGCAGSGVTTRTYVENRERVDQEMTGGNFGYIQGQPTPADRSGLKNTRKVYVLEFTKQDEQADDEPVVITRTKIERVPVETPARRVPPPQPQPIQIPSFEEEMEPATSPGSFVDYEVQKDDTLQKISKKFYDTYRKWPQIYEVNKEKIKDPNRIKPGITLQIPVE